MKAPHFTTNKVIEENMWKDVFPEYFPELVLVFMAVVVPQKLQVKTARRK